MSDNTILGKNFVLWVYVEDNYYPIACGRTMTLNNELEMIEATDVNAGTARSWRPRFSSATASFEGVTTSTNINGKISPFYLLEESQRRALQNMKAVFTDQDGTPKVIQFYAYVRQNNFVGATGGTRVASTLEFQITGLPAISDLTPPETAVCSVDSNYYATTPDQSYVIIAALIAKDILEVWREGTQYDIVTGTPSGRQVKYTSSTGRFDFDTNIPFNPNETVFVVWQ